MDFNNKLFTKFTEPYKREMLYCLVLDVVVVVVGAVIFVAIKILDFAPYLFCFFPLYFVFECFVNYRIFLTNVYEKSFKKISCEELKIIKIYEESSASGWLWTSIVSKLYPKELGVCRYKIVCLKKDGSKLKLRSAMSSKKARKMVDIFVNKQIDEVKLTYCKFTKIIIKIEEISKSKNKNDEIDSLNYLL